jgi:hypothetical protein
MEDVIGNHSTLQMSVALASFSLSVFIIFSSLLVLVRFWVFKSIGYNIFIISMIIVGIVYNVTSINMALFESDVI